MPNIGTYDQLQTAHSQMANLNKKVIDKIPEKMLKQGKPIKIYNVGPWLWIRPMGSLGTFTIPACPPGAEYSPPLEIPYVLPETVPHEASNWKMTTRFEDGMDVALGILGEGPFQSKEQGWRRFGVFVAAGEKPTEAEIEAAEECLRKYRTEQVQEADNLWNQGPLHYASIVAEHRDAAIALGVEREWLKPIKETIECPGCGARVNPNIAIHALQQGGCGVIINEQKYRSMKWAGEKPSSPSAI